MIIFLIFLLLLVSQVEAEELEVVVKGAPLTLPKGVSVIESESVSQERPLRGSQDYFRYQPGLWVQDTSFGKKVYLRGLEEENYRIFWHGAELPNRGTYHTRGFEWDALPYLASTQVVLLKGPFSAEYGAQPGGFVDFKWLPPSKTQALWQAGSGSFSEHFGAGRFDYRRGPYALLSGGHFRETHTFLRTHTTRDWDLWLAPFWEFKPAHLISAYGHLFQKIEEFPFDPDLKFNIYEKWRYEPGSHLEYFQEEGQFRFETPKILFLSAYNRQKREDHVKSHWAKTRKGYHLLPRRLSYVSDRTITQGPYFKFRLSPFSEVPLRFGFEYQRPDTEIDFLTPFWRQKLFFLSERITSWQKLYGSFVEVEVKRERLLAYLGLRGDLFESHLRSWRRLPSGKEETFSHRERTSHLSLSARFGLHPRDDLRFSLAFGSIFNPPRSMDYVRWASHYTPSARAKAVVAATPSLAARFDLSTPEGQAAWRKTLGKLSPEKGYALEGEINFQRPTFSFTLRPYLLRVKDYIQKYPTTHAPTYNVDHYLLKGVEIQSVWHLNPSLTLAADFTLQDGERHGDPLLDYDGLINTPKRSGNLRLILEKNNWLFVPALHYAGHRRTGGAPIQEITRLPSYVLMDLALHWKKRGWSVSFYAENLLDHDGYQRLDAPLPDRRLFLEISRRFW